MDAALTLAEIEARFDSEWVLVGDPELDEAGRLVRGKVRFHSKSRDEVDEKDRELRPAAAAILYTGRIPDDAALNMSHASPLPELRRLVNDARASRSSGIRCRHRRPSTACSGWISFAAAV
jgi:hypothetical protein